MVRTVICVCSLAFVLKMAAAQSDLSYNRHIRPILSDNCFTCHGQDEQARRSRLRLDLREAALRGGKSQLPAIVPGDVAKSELLARILTDKEDDRMPPPDSGKSLTKEQQDLLRGWIAAGANYEEHWAFVPPARPELPMADTAMAQKMNPVDAFIRARVQDAGLKPSPEAAPEKLIRRLSLDLTGLPPTLAEIDEFVSARQKSSTEAWTRLVERLLDSPHFGEKWARHWLDAARYADSDGYEKDLPRKQWPWRDWVIRSLNADMPYNEFIVEQIAGDLLAERLKPEDSPDADLAGRKQDLRTATGFLRNGMVNEEGAIIPEQWRLEGMFDRMDCVGKAVLGITLQCAQCHTHKFDPLSHEDYYRMFAFLNNTYDRQMWVYSTGQLRKIETIRREIER